MKPMRVAAVNWQLRPIGSEREFVDHAVELLSQAKSKGAQLVVFPEFFTLELLFCADKIKIPSMAQQVPFSILETIRDHAKALNLIWIAGSTFSHHVVQSQNVACAFWPDGRYGIQTKNVLTQFELNEWGMAAGSGSTRLPDPRFGINICYDCEFPNASRDLAEHGMLCLCVVAYTETPHGFHRVRTSCLARAIEYQIFVIHSSLVGSLGREPVTNATGSSAIIAPSIEPFPAEGILAETEHDVEAIAIADLDFEALIEARNQGDVRNWHDRDRGNWLVGD